MIELRSLLFRGDTLLQAIAEDLDTADGGLTRISRSRNENDPAVLKLQQALLDWRPDCLPLGGADGNYGEESAGAVHRFQVEELMISEPGNFDDVGPRTVQRLDEIRARAEADARTETAGDEVVVTDIPFVKFYGQPDALPPEITATDDLFGSYEVVNFGTAPSTAQDQVWWSVITQGTIFQQAHHNLDDPPVEPNGGTYRGGVRIRGNDLNVLGAWEIVFFVTDVSGQIVDEASVPFDVVASA